MENKKTFIKLFMSALEGYVLTLGIWNSEKYDTCFSNSLLSSAEDE